MRCRLHRLRLLRPRGKRATWSRGCARPERWIQAEVLSQGLARVIDRGTVPPWNPRGGRPWRPLPGVSGSRPRPTGGLGLPEQRRAARGYVPRANPGGWPQPGQGEAQLAEDLPARQVVPRPTREVARGQRLRELRQPLPGRAVVPRLQPALPAPRRRRHLPQLPGSGTSLGTHRRPGRRHAQQELAPARQPIHHEEVSTVSGEANADFYELIVERQLSRAH
jgi:hypothetical protein